MCIRLSKDMESPGQSLLLHSLIELPDPIWSDAVYSVIQALVADKFQFEVAAATATQQMEDVGNMPSQDDKFNSSSNSSSSSTFTCLISKLQTLVGIPTQASSLKFGLLVQT